MSGRPPRAARVTTANDRPPGRRSLPSLRHWRVGDIDSAGDETGRRGRDGTPVGGGRAAVGGRLTGRPLAILGVASTETRRGHAPTAPPTPRRARLPPVGALRFRLLRRCLAGRAEKANKPGVNLSAVDGGRSYGITCGRSPRQECQRKAGRRLRPSHPPDNGQMTRPGQGQDHEGSLTSPRPPQSERWMATFW